MKNKHTTHSSAVKKQKNKKAIRKKHLPNRIKRRVLSGAFKKYEISYGPCRYIRSIKTRNLNEDEKKAYNKNKILNHTACYDLEEYEKKKNAAPEKCFYKTDFVNCYVYADSMEIAIAKAECLYNFFISNRCEPRYKTNMYVEHKKNKISHKKRIHLLCCYNAKKHYDAESIGARKIEILKRTKTKFQRENLFWQQNHKRKMKKTRTAR